MSHATSVMAHQAEHAPAADQENAFASSEKHLDSSSHSDAPVVEKSRGIRRVEIISAQYGRVGTFFVFFSIFLIAYSYGLDLSVRYQFQSFAQSSYGTHSLTATINICTSVIAVAAQPFFARLSDVFGRAELLCVCILFYVIGTILESQAHNASIYAGGAVLFQFGYTGVLLLMQLIAADFSLLNWRLLASFIPATPFIINTWISGNVVSAMGTKWSWGIAMWAIIFPFACVPLLVCLGHMHYRAKKSGALAALEAEGSEFRHHGGTFGFFKWLFFKLDIIGIFLLVAFLALFLVPFSLAGGVSTEWGKAKIIAPLVVGFCVLPFFVLWERQAEHPIVPFHLLKKPGVWAAMCIGVLINWVWYMQGDFMYTVLVVAVNQSYLSATRITSMYSFVSVITGTLLGFVIARVRYLKPFIIFGASIFLVAMGMLIHFRGGSDSKPGIVGSLCLLGFGAGFFTYPTQASIQTNTGHEHMAVVTSLYLSSYYIGSALGNTISGTIWTQVLPEQIKKEFAQFANDTLVTYAYGSPFQFVIDYPWTSPERQALVIAYKHTQRLLLITGTCLCVPLIIFTLLLNNPKLKSRQNLYDDDESSIDKPIEKTWKEKSWRERIGV